MSAPTLFELVATESEREECRIARYLLALGHDELLVLSLIAERLEEGHARYGPLDVHGDARDWRLELGLEAADALVYAGAAHLRQLARPSLRIVPPGHATASGASPAEGPATEDA